MIYADAHCHSNPTKGLGARKIARKFKSVGGWFIALVSLPPYHYGFTEPTIESYVRTIELMYNEKKAIIEEGLKTKLFTGFHPAEVDEYLRRGLSPEKILVLAERVLDLIIEYAEKGVIDGIGEVGRQHYSTSPDRIVLSEVIMIKALERAKDHGLPVHLHLEQGGIITVTSIDKFTKLLSIPTNLILFHHVNYDTGYWSERLGYWHTIPTKLRDFKKALPEKRTYLLVESDFIDDPKRPGVSAYPWDIARFIEKIVEENIADRDYIEKIMTEHISKYYHVEPP
ncbi:MAG: TatD family hydrolase [Thermoprotei archaeon]